MDIKISLSLEQEINKIKHEDKEREERRIKMADQ
jgi:hypothetical protein